MKPHHTPHDRDAYAHLLLYQWRVANNALPQGGNRRQFVNAPQMKTRAF
jgi:hypothetical protein